MANISKENRRQEGEKEIAANIWRELIAAGFDARLFNQVNATQTALGSRYLSGSIGIATGQQRSNQFSNRGGDA